MRERNHIEGAMRNYRIIYAVVAVLVVFGIYALGRMNKDEFPQVTIRQGLIVAVYPGATAQEVEEQVAKPIEQYLFSFKERSPTYWTSLRLTIWVNSVNI